MRSCKMFFWYIINSNIALGSLRELDTQFIIAKEVDLLDQYRCQKR